MNQKLYENLKLKVHPCVFTYLDNLDAPDIITDSYLFKIGSEILNTKISAIEEENSARSGRKVKIPNKLDADEIVCIIIKLFHIANIVVTKENDGTLLGYYDSQEGIYIVNPRKIERIVSMVEFSQTAKDRQEVLTKLTVSCECVEQSHRPEWCPVNNGIYDAQLDTLIPFKPDRVFLTKFKVDYNPDAQKPIIEMPDGVLWDVDSWIDELVEAPEIATLIWQVISDALQPNVCRGKSIWFYSSKGNNGKGTVGQLIKNLVGDGNYAGLSVSDFKVEFYKEMLIGKALNIADENDVETYIDSAKDYKASITGDDIFINRKFQQPIQYQFRGANIQMLNGLPKTKDKTGSFYRRILLVPFTKSFTNNGERKYIKTDYIHRQDVLEYVLAKALKMRFNDFIDPDESQWAMSQYMEMNDPVLQFWMELKDEFVWDLLPTKFLYDLYVGWFRENNPSGTVIGKYNFAESLSNIVQTNSGGDWESCMDSRSTNINTGTRMDEQEPLILRYDLKNWMNPNTTSNRPEKVLAFERKSKYRGLVRKTSLR